MFGLFAAGGFLVFLLIAKVNYRNENYLGMLITTFKEFRFELTRFELNVAAFAVSLMSSPCVYMILVSSWN